MQNSWEAQYFLQIFHAMLTNSWRLFQTPQNLNIHDLDVSDISNISSGQGRAHFQISPTGSEMRHLGNAELWQLEASAWFLAPQQTEVSVN